MVYPIIEAAKVTPTESDKRLKVRPQETQESLNTAPVDHDSVSLSKTSKHLEALKASLQDLPEINAARVLYFRAEIESGNYKINSDKIAANMLNNIEEMV